MAEAWKEANLARSSEFRGTKFILTSPDLAHGGVFGGCSDHVALELFNQTLLSKYSWLKSLFSRPLGLLREGKCLGDHQSRFPGGCLILGQQGTLCFSFCTLNRMVACSTKACVSSPRRPAFWRERSMPADNTCCFHISWSPHACS